MPKKELDLFQLAAIHMTELCACSAKVVRGKMVELYPLGATPNHVPDDVFGDSFSPRCIVTANGSKDLAGVDLGFGHPVVHRLFDPAGHGHGPNMTTLADKIHDRPMSLSDLHVLHSQGR